MAKSKKVTRWERLGFNPPGTGSGDEEYEELVTNIVREHQKAVEAAAEDDPDGAAAERANYFDGLQSRIDAKDLEAALTRIDHAASFPQHTAPIGGEPTTPEES